MIHSRTSSFVWTLLDSKPYLTLRKLKWQTKVSRDGWLHQWVSLTVLPSFFSFPVFHCLRGFFYKFYFYWNTSKGKNKIYITNGLLLLVPIHISQNLSFSGDMFIFFTSDQISQISLLLSPQMEILGKPQRKATEAKIILQISLWVPSKPTLWNTHRHKIDNAISLCTYNLLS